jgi:hypothetical protein
MGLGLFDICVLYFFLKVMAVPLLSPPGAIALGVRTMPRSGSRRQWLAAVFDVTSQLAAKQAFRSASDWYLAKGGDRLLPFSV